MRIHAYIAKFSDLSRREAEKLVEEGLVTIDGQKAQVGQKVEGKEVIYVGNRRILSAKAESVVLAFHKPEGYECSRKPQTGESIYDLLPDLRTGKWILIGRLDLNTSGLILVTNDGDIANKLAHPSGGYDREYLVRINGELTASDLSNLRKGIRLEDGIAKVKQIELHRKSKGVNVWYKMVLTEGRNRIVRRLMEACEKNVSRLIRVRFGPIKLEKALPVGSYQKIDPGFFTKL